MLPALGIAGREFWPEWLLLPAQRRQRPFAAGRSQGMTSWGGGASTGT